MYFLSFIIVLIIFLFLLGLLLTKYNCVDKFKGILQSPAIGANETRSVYGMGSCASNLNGYNYPDNYYVGGTVNNYCGTEFTQNNFNI